MISAAVEIARGLGGEAHHQHGADREVRRDRRPARPALAAAVDDRRCPSRSCRRRTGRRRRARRGRSSTHHRPGAVKSTIASASPSDRDELVAGGLERRARAPRRPSRRGRSGGSSCRARERRRHALDGLQEPLLARPDPGSREALGREQRRRRARRHDSASTASTSAITRSSERISESVTSDFPSRFMWVEVDSIESRTAPLRFSFARSSSRRETLPAAMSAICSTAIASAVDEVLLAGADVDADLARVGVLRGERCRRSTPSRASRGSPGRAATTRSRRGSRRGSTRRSGERSEREIPGAPRQTWYCSVSLRWKRSAGRRRLHEWRADVRLPTPRLAAALERAATTSSTTCSWSTFPAAAKTMFAGVYIARW